MLILNVSDIHFRAPQCLKPDTDPDLPYRTRMLQGLREQVQIHGDVDLEAKLEEWERFYNLARPHGAFNGKTPYEALREKL